LCVRQGVPPQGTKWGDYYRRNIKNYLAMVTGVDEQFGRILKAIDKRGLKDDTIVIFMSDHGNCLGIHNEEAKNNHYEESMRIPFIIRWPGKIKSVKDDLLFSPPDIYPTIMGLMGFEDDVPEDVEGTDFSSLLLGGETKRPSSQLYIRVPYGEPSGGQRGVRTKRYTLMAEKVSGGSLNYVLHDNIEDPCQMKNIADEHLDLVKDLIEKELRPWLKKTSDPWIVNLEEST